MTNKRFTKEELQQLLKDFKIIFLNFKEEEFYKNFVKFLEGDKESLLLLENFFYIIHCITNIFVHPSNLKGSINDYEKSKSLKHYENGKFQEYYLSNHNRDIAFNILKIFSIINFEIKKTSRRQKQEILLKRTEFTFAGFIRNLLHFSNITQKEYNALLIGIDKSLKILKKLQENEYNKYFNKKEIEFEKEQLSKLRQNILVFQEKEKEIEGKEKEIEKRKKEFKKLSKPLKKYYKTSKQAHKDCYGLNSTGGLMTIARNLCEEKNIDNKQLSLFLDDKYKQLQFLYRFNISKIEMKFITILSYMTYYKIYLDYNQDTSTYYIDINEIVKGLYPNLKATKKSNKINQLINCIEKIQSTEYKFQNEKGRGSLILISEYFYNKHNKRLRLRLNPRVDFNKNWNENVRNYIKINYIKQIQFIDDTHQADSFSRWFYNKILTYPNGTNKINIFNIEPALPKRCLGNASKKIDTIYKSLASLEKHNIIRNSKIDIKTQKIHFDKLDIGFIELSPNSTNNSIKETIQNILKEEFGKAIYNNFFAKLEIEYKNNKITFFTNMEIIKETIKIDYLQKIQEILKKKINVNQVEINSLNTKGQKN
jgi:hypothetical protein